MQYLRQLDMEHELSNRAAMEEDRQRYYELASEMSSLEYFHFSSYNISSRANAALELCLAQAQFDGFTGRSLIVRCDLDGRSTVLLAQPILLSN